MTGYKILEAAAADLKKIWHYTVKSHGELQAGIYTDALKAGCARIAEYPMMWREIEIAGDAVRVCHCQHHYIIYMIGDDGCAWVLAFLHENTDFMERLRKRLNDRQ